MMQYVNIIDQEGISLQHFESEVLNGKPALMTPSKGDRLTLSARTESQRYCTVYRVIEISWSHQLGTSMHSSWTCEVTVVEESQVKKQEPHKEELQKLANVAKGIEIFLTYATRYTGVGVAGKSLNVFFTGEIPDHTVDKLQGMGWDVGDDPDLILQCGSYWTIYRP